MPDFGNVQASPVEDLLMSSQGPNAKNTAISVVIASNSTTASQAQGTPQLQEPSSNAVNPSTTSLDAQQLNLSGSGVPVGTEMAISVSELIHSDPTRTHVPQPQRPPSNAVHQPTTALDVQTLSAPVQPADGHMVLAEPVHNLIPDVVVNYTPAATRLLNTDGLTSSPRTHVGIEGKTTNGDARAQSAQSLLNGAESSSTGPQASTTVNESNPQTFSGKTNFAYGTSTPTPFLGTDNRLGLLSGTQTLSATSDSQDKLPSDQTLSLVSSPAYGSGTSTSAQNLPISITQVLYGSSSTASLLFRPSATPSISKEPSPLTISGQTVTANSLGQYSIDNQTLTPGGVITVSGSKIWLAPNASELIIGTSTEALGPSVSASLGSGPKGTEVQKFTGNALGASDGLWSSSTMLLVSFLLLLWV